MRWWAAAALPVLALAPPPAGADDKADALVKRAQEAYRSAKSLEGEGTVKAGPLSLAVQFKYLRPNYAHIRISGIPGGGDQLLISDGKSLFMVQSREKQYQKQAAPAEGLPMLGSSPDPITAFWSTGPLAGGDLKHAGTKEVGGRSYEVVEASGPHGKRTLYFGASGLLEGQESGGPSGQAIWVKEQKLDPDLAPSAFAYTPPAGVKEFDPNEAMNRSLVPVGRQAPGFTLPTPAGGQLSLNSMLKGRKALVLNFWFYG